jgi:CHAD domain-containing protein
MAFELKPNEPVSAGIMRNVKSQIEKAIRHVGGVKEGSAARQPPAQETVENAAIFEVRKCFKRVRSALRMAREELGDDFYREENWWFRDAARPLTQVRDAAVLVETAEKLRQELVRATGPAAFRKIRLALIANQTEVRRRVLEEGQAFAKVEEAARRALARLPQWGLRRNGWAAVESGLRRVYRQGHRALALAAESPTVANLHEWRKQTKYLRYELQLVEAAWPEPERELVTRTHQLATLLGEDHDLAVLRETLAADPLPYGGHHVLKNVFAVIDRHRADLERQAFALGREIYKDPPRAFVSRIQALMQYKEAA